MRMSEWTGQQIGLLEGDHSSRQGSVFSSHSSGYLLTRSLSLSLNEKIVVFIVLALVVIAWTVDSVLHPRIENTDLNNVAVMITKDMNPTLFPTDFTFSEQSFYQAYTPLYRWVVGHLWQWSGNFESSLIWLVPAVLSVYLLGMFILLYQISGNAWIALGLTVIAAHYHDMMGAEVWGVGGATQMMARALFMAVLPYLALWFFFTVQKISFFKVGVLGLAVGLAANLHPGSGMHLAVLLASTLILTYGFRRESWSIWGMIPLMVITVLLGAWPIVKTVTSNFGAEVTSTVSFDTFRRAVSERYPLYFYPNRYEWHGLEITRPNLDVLVWLYISLALIGLVLYLWVCWRSKQAAEWWRWAWLIGGLVTVGYAYMVALFEMSVLFGLVALYIIYRFVHPKFRFLDWLMLGMMAIVILQSFVGYYLMTLAWDTFELQGLTPVLIEQFRSARFVYLPVYILAGLALATLVIELGNLVSRFLRKNNVGEASLCLAKLPTPYSLLLALPGMLVIVGVLFGPLAPVFAPILPLPTVNLLNPANRVPDPPWPENDAQLYHWVRENTPTDALFFWCDFGPSTTLRFRREAQRGITHNWKDLGWAAYNGTSLVPLLDRYRRLEQACLETSTALITAYEIGADYILVPTAKAVELQAASCFANDRYLVFGLGENACQE